jgi:16S rRNA (cytidine1402-2'-O)-methyltransferase
LAQFVQYFGADRKASVSREISKFYETTQRGSLSELVEFFTKNPPKGEIVIVIEGRK